MGRLYNRRAYVAIGPEVGDETTVIMPGTLRVSFSVVKTVASQPNALNVQIYNLNRASRAKIESPEINIVTLHAGYEDDIKGNDPKSLPIVSRADITNVHHRKYGNDYVTEIEAGEGTVTHALAFVNDRIKPGANVTAIFDLLKESFNKVQVDADGISANRGFAVCKDFEEVIKEATTEAKSARLAKLTEIYDKNKNLANGITLHGFTRDIMDNLADRHELWWYLENNVLIVTPLSGFIKSGVNKVFTPENGLRGVPEKMDKGGVCICLNLTPAVVPWSQLEIGMNLKENKQLFDGKYTLRRVEHQGDTGSSGPWNSIAEGFVL